MKRKHNFILLLNRLGLKRILLSLVTLLWLTVTSLYGRQPAPEKGSETVTFRFVPGTDKFALQGNEAELTRPVAATKSTTP